MRTKFLIFAFAMLSTVAFAQDDLLKELDDQKPKEKQLEKDTFKGLQIANMQSTKMAAKNEWYFVVSHRFGDLTLGFENFFGLDNAFTKIGGIYGINNWLTASVSRHTYNKIYEIGVKYKLANQEKDGFPLTIVGYNTMDINSALKTEEYPNLVFNDRLAYSTQLLISRKFNKKLSLEMAPIYVHKNLYQTGLEEKDLFLLGAGGRYKFSKRMSVNLEYAVQLNTSEDLSSQYHNPLTLGVDIETGGHIFQLVLSNSQQMNDVSVFSNATGDWNGGSIYFGFNMYRVF
ncbi:MAG: DUF5777 family beta-barrel protein [Flavobacterium sp.]